ncbi:high-affinity branched-chain amino acid transport ATP-binding protein LivG [Clostridium aceticum]|uniref:High-affinity branched-chain amino acid transport ATP-binding protein LivG n=1 Tax=Clostridium aceticum TaxID=84022 RepID=A0A0D8IB67_9CLOT|nr:ABC transporter ATP-binding protein [Clostridium aceticum]AKL96744.1 high-affinity branched-chain amino acid transport ATP-binding protein LivG [Clostridium aceticum]KJF27508.1 hypothetical protein TZ02_06855 [Clostridium aceticum]
MKLLEVDNLTMMFGGLKAVNDVNLNISQGEIVSLIGPNGAGKTTFFNMLTGIYKPTSGTIQFENKKIDGIPPQKIIESGIARTFQNIRLFSHMTVLENVLLGMHSCSTNNLLHSLLRTKKFYQEEKENTAKAKELLATVNLLKKSSDYAKNLSYGQQRKLEIIRALASQPKLILLDEPAAGMNPQETEDLMRYISGLKDLGITVLLIEHDMKLVMKISDRIYVLDHGTKIAEGEPSVIKNNQAVIEAYLGKGA